MSDAPPSIDRTLNFAMTGVAGFVAPRHLQAIHATGNRLIAAVDPHDSVGILDRHFPEARFFTEIERFERFIEKRRRGSPDERVDYVTVCSPNYLHDSQIRLAMRAGANVICEKPLVVNPWNMTALAELEQETGCRVWTVLQLRLHPALLALKQRLAQSRGTQRADVRLAYVSRRGPWYHRCWKGSEEKSGGVTMNIGIHFFDLLLWLFGPVKQSAVHLRTPEKAAGRLELEAAAVRWFLSIDRHDLPEEARLAGRAAHRRLTVDDDEIDFSTGFEDLHTRVYEETLAGRGFSIDDARPSLELVHAIRTAEVTPPAGEHEAHELLTK